MSEAVHAAPLMIRLVERVDRLLPLAWLGLYLTLPVSGEAASAFASWHDQGVFLEALRSVLAEGRASDIADNIVGPGYIATAALVHDVFGLTPEDSLIALNRVSYAVSVATGMIVVGVLTRRGVGSARPMVSIAAQVGFVALVLAAGTWRWSDIPWTHFFAAALALGFYAVRLIPRSSVRAVLVGAALALLASTRSFELIAVVAAWVLVGGAVVALGGRPRPRPREVVFGTCVFVLTTAVVYVATGKRDLFLLYGSDLDNQAADVLPAQVAESPPVSIGYIPAKLVQLFVDPCYYSLCSLTEYSAGMNVWRAPLALQQPALVFLPVCIAATVAGFVLLALRRHSDVVTRAGSRMLAEMTVVSAGLTLGYLASTLAGSSHLKFGFAREFVLPGLLTGVVATTLLTTGVWAALGRSEGRPLLRRAGISSESVVLVLTLVGSMALLGGVSLARDWGLPAFEGRHLGSLEYTATCNGASCRIAIQAETPSGRSIAIPEASTLTFGCGSDRPAFTVYEATPTDGVRVGGQCREPKLLSAWPTIMGLPPDQAHLGAVSVVNTGVGT